MKVKPWQIAVIVLGLAIGLGSVIYSAASTDASPVKSIEYLVDVETGDLYRADLRMRAVLLPARHPETHRICLVRIRQDDGGKWSVSKRDRSLLSMLDKDVVNKAVDQETGDLLMPAKAPVEYLPVKKSP